MRPGRGEIWGVSLVRDEIDVIESSVRHMLAQGVDQLLIVDHCSEDGTRELLTALAARDPRVHVGFDDLKAHKQMEKITYLSRIAWRSGAAWVIPFDADEFWYAQSRSVAEYLRGLRREVGVAAAAMHSAVPTQQEAATAFRSQPFRVDLVPTGDPKTAFRAHPLVGVAPGNHGVSRIGATTNDLHIVHVPYRGADQIGRKYRNGAASLAAGGAPEWEGWHWRAGSRLATEAVNAAWNQMREGKAVDELGWSWSGSYVTGKVLEAETWRDITTRTAT